MAEFEDDAALVGFEDALRFALAPKAPGGWSQNCPSRPVATSHSRRVLSADQDRMRVASLAICSVCVRPNRYEPF